jgi:hypothetical protein
MDKDATAPTKLNTFKHTLTEDSQTPNKKRILSLTKSRKSSPITSTALSLESKLTEYACPICSNDLSSIKSSYMRQRHVEECMKSNTFTESHDDSLEFDDCIFCGKILSHMNLTRRQIHLNTCLDDIKDEPETPRSEPVFAGQRMPFLETLSICPICHESTSFDQRRLKQKVAHIKQCRKQYGLSVSQLLQKFRWIGWGHSFTTPSKPDNISNNNEQNIIQRDSDTNNYSQSSSSINSSNKIHHEYQAIDCPVHDDDFNNNVMISKMNHSLLSAQPNAKDDKLDEELQMALAISRSLQPDNSQKRRTLKRTDERDWNAANIWSIEESKMKVYEKLDLILFPEKETKLVHQQEFNRSIGIIGPSRLKTIENHPKNISFWQLASNTELNWENSSIFTSDFIHQLKR